MKLRVLGFVFLAEVLLGHTCAGVIAVCDESTLRSAVAAGEHIRFDCGAIITLSNTLTIATNCVIDGNGHAVTLDGADRVRVLHILPGCEVTILNLQISGGRSTNGGGIYNEGTLSLLNSRLVGNRAVGTPGLTNVGGNARGGAVYNLGSLVISNSVIATNSAIGGVGVDGTNGTHSIDTIDQFGRCRSSPNTPGGPGRHGGSGHGGGLYNAGTTIVANTSFVLNRAEGGAGGAGGWSGRSGCLSVPQPGGSPGAGGSGRGAAAWNQGSLTIYGSTLIHNDASGGEGGRGGSPWCCAFTWLAAPGGPGGDGEAGAIYNLGLSEVWNTTFSANQASGGNGGAGGVASAPPVALTCSVQTNGNGGNAFGGAIANYGWLFATNATIWNNLASAGTSTNQNLFYTNCPPLSGNSGNGRGSSIAAVLGYVYLANTILDNCYGVMSDGGYNICSDGSAAFTAQGSANNTDPRLSPLGNHGGLTWTHALFAGSPALDNGPVDSFPATDQRGVLRPQQNRCDIGAYEATFLALAFRPSGDVQFEFSWVPFERCRLQSSINLADWENVEIAISGNDGHVRFTTTASGAARFFRVGPP